jgi:dienelactone hydrolase
MRKSVATAIVLAWLSAMAPFADVHAQGLADYGIVLMHGKQGGPGSKNITALAAALRSQGAKVAMPEMPWSRNRMYNANYEQAIAEIDRAVAQLKAQGAQRIVVAGQSFGANAAIGYGARRGGLAAVIALAPGHTPDRPGFQKSIGDAVARAKQLVGEGKGDTPTSFADVNQGQSFNVMATPKIYLSFFDPTGPAVMPQNAAAMKPVPFLWVIGRSDLLYAAGREYAFNKGAKHPKSRYLEVNAGHFNTADVATAEVIAWLKSL